MQNADIPMLLPIPAPGRGSGGAAIPVDSAQADDWQAVFAGGSAAAGRADSARSIPAGLAGLRPPPGTVGPADALPTAFGASPPGPLAAAPSRPGPTPGRVPEQAATGVPATVASAPTADGDSDQPAAPEVAIDTPPGTDTDPGADAVGALPAPIADTAPALDPGPEVAAQPDLQPPAAPASAVAGAAHGTEPAPTATARNRPDPMHESRAAPRADPVPEFRAVTPAPPRGSATPARATPHDPQAGAARPEPSQMPSFAANVGPDRTPGTGQPPRQKLDPEIASQRRAAPDAEAGGAGARRDAPPARPIPAIPPGGHEGVLPPGRTGPARSDIGARLTGAGDAEPRPALVPRGPSKPAFPAPATTPPGDLGAQAITPLKETPPGPGPAIGAMAPATAGASPQKTAGGWPDAAAAPSRSPPVAAVASRPDRGAAGDQGHQVASLSARPATPAASQTVTQVALPPAGAPDMSRTGPLLPGAGGAAPLPAGLPLWPAASAGAGAFPGGAVRTDNPGPTPDLPRLATPTRRASTPQGGGLPAPAPPTAALGGDAAVITGAAVPHPVATAAPALAEKLALAPIAADPGSRAPDPGQQVSPAAPQPPRPVAEQVAARVMALHAEAAGQGSMELTLDPPELGKLRIVLTQGGEGLTLTISADRGDTLDLLRRHGGLLAQEFTRDGLSNLNFSFAKGGGEAGHSREIAMEPPNPEDPEAQTAAADPAPVARTAAAGGLDLRI